MEKYSGESLFEELMLALVALHSAVLFLGVCWFNIELNKAMKVERCHSCSRERGIFFMFLFFILKEKSVNCTVKEVKPTRNIFHVQIFHIDGVYDMKCDCIIK